MTKTPLYVLVSLLVAAVAPACSATHTQSTPSPEQFPRPDTAVTVSAQRLDDDAFCQSARQAGITNVALSAQNADPATLLPALDQLVPQAPPSIRDDFATFDNLEHALFDPAHPDDAPGQPLNQPGTRDAITRVMNYLKSTCHIT
jgi:hypothetical protein